MFGALWELMCERTDLTVLELAFYVVGTLVVGVMGGLVVGAINRVGQ